MRLAMEADLPVHSEATESFGGNQSILGKQKMLASFSYDADKAVENWRASHSDLNGPVERTKL